MSDEQFETGQFLSLAELAMMNTDEIAVLTSRLPDAGIFTVRGVSVVAGETKSEDPTKPPLFRFGFQYEVLAAKPLDKSKDPETLVGKTLRESYTLWPADFAEGIGLLKGRYMLVGLPNKGMLGGVEGQEPGWMDGVVNHIFDIRVRHWTDKSGQDRANFDWLKVKEEKEGE